MSQLTFDPKLGLVAPETESIREAVQSDWQGAFRDVDVELNVEPSTPAGQLVDAETAEIEAKNAELLFLSNMFNPKVSEGRWQDALGYIYFLTRKIAQPTVVECSVTGLMGTTIPYGAMAQSTDGYYLLNTGAFTIPESGTATGYFRLAEPGPIPIAAGSVTKIVTLIPGWSSIVNKSAGVVGRDVETRAEFESRRYASVAKNAHGTAPSLYGALADLDGVIDCRVLENITNVEVVKYGVTLEGHSVAACVYGGDDTAIAEVIFRKKDAGCGTSGNTEVTYEDPERSNAYGGPLYHSKIVRPSVETFWIQVNLVSKSLMAETTLEAVRQAVMDDFLGKSEASGNARVGLAQTVYASRFYTSVMAVEGITYLKNVKIRLGGFPETWLDVVDIDADVEPTLTLDNILVNVTES